MSKYRNWMITDNDLSSNIKKICKKGHEKVVYAICQKEKGNKEGRIHYQGYIEFKNVMRMSEVKKVLESDTVHLEPRWGTQQQAIDYCSKEDTKIKGPYIFGTQKRQGNRSELDSLVDCIESGMTTREILLEHKGIALKHINMITKGLTVYHELSALDSYILGNRKNASEVAGNTVPATNNDFYKEAKDEDYDNRELAKQAKVKKSVNFK